MPGAGHGGHEGRLVDDQEVFVFKENWYVVWDGRFWCRHAVEVHHRVGGENAIGAQWGAILAYDFLFIEAGLERDVIVFRMAVPLRGDEVVHEVPRGNWAFWYPGVGGV